MKMKYLVIGAGGTGGCIGAYMTEAGKDVTMIARGAHLQAIQANGMLMETTHRGSYRVYPMEATDMEHYSEHPDVVFVCVKGYSIEETISFIEQAALPHTVVIPILNLYGTGRKMQERLPGLLVTDGCIYVSANISKPGTIWMHGDIFRIVYGVRQAKDYRPVLDEIAKDLQECGITAILSENIRRDALQKFSFVSAMATCGLYYDAQAEEMQQQGEIRKTFIALLREIDALAQAMGIPFSVDIVKTNLKILDELIPSASTSMQRDIAQGKSSEIDGIIFEVLRMGGQYGVSMPHYKKSAEKFGFSMTE